MKIFQTIQKNHAIVCISRQQTKTIIGRIVVTFSFFGLSFTSSAVYFFHEANTFLEYSNNMYITTGQAMILIVCTIVTFKMAALFRFIDHLEELINKRLELRSKAIYEETAQQVEKWCKIGYFLMTKVTPACWISPKGALNYFIYFSSNVGNESFDLPLLMWFPFNWKTPTGYLAAIAYQYIGVTYCFLFGAGVVFLGIGTFLFEVTGIKEIEINLKSINERGVLAKNLSFTLTQFSDFIQFHSQLKQIVYEFLQIYQPQFMVLCTWSLGTMCGVMLMIQIQLHEFISLAVLLLTIFYAAYAFGVVLIICELGQRLTNAFEGINDEIDRFDWYLFPPQIQRLLPIIMIDTQQPVELQCFGSITGTRETFKILVKTGNSYFMVMRQFM